MGARVRGVGVGMGLLRLRNGDVGEMVLAALNWRVSKRSQLVEKIQRHSNTVKAGTDPPTLIIQSQQTVESARPLPPTW